MAVYDRQPLYIKEPPNDPFAGWRALQFRYFQENRGGATAAASKDPTLATVKDRRADALAVSYRVKGIRSDGGDSTTDRATAGVDEREVRDGGNGWRGAGPSRRPAGRRIRRAPPPPGTGGGGPQLSSVQTTRPPQLEYVSLSVRMPPADAYGGRPERVAAARPAGSCGTTARDEPGRSAAQLQQRTPDEDSASGSCGNRAATAVAQSLRSSVGGRDSSADADYSPLGRATVSRGDIAAAAPITPTDAAERGERRKTVVSGAVRLSALIPRDGRGGGGRTAHWRQQLNSFRLHGGEVGGSVVDEAAYEQYARRRAIR